MKEGMVEFNAYSLWQFNELGNWKAEVNKNLKLSVLMEDLLTLNKGTTGYSKKKGRLLYKELLVVCEMSLRIPMSLKVFRDCPTEGHSGYIHT